MDRPCRWSTPPGPPRICDFRRKTRILPRRGRLRGKLGNEDLNLDSLIQSQPKTPSWPERRGFWPNEGRSACRNAEYGFQREWRGQSALQPCDADAEPPKYVCDCHPGSTPDSVPDDPGIPESSRRDTFRKEYDSRYSALILLLRELNLKEYFHRPVQRFQRDDRKIRGWTLVETSDGEIILALQFGEDLHWTPPAL